MSVLPRQAHRAVSPLPKVSVDFCGSWSGYKLFYPVALFLILKVNPVELLIYCFVRRIKMFERKGLANIRADKKSACDRQYQNIRPKNREYDYYY